MILNKTDIYEWMRKNSERQADIDAEREKAYIRAQSHALVWSGPVDELTATIRRWWESGWIPGVTVEEALRIASIHFVGPDGRPIVRFDPVPPPPQHTQTASNPRQALVFPLLEKKGWSISDWALESGVAPATAHDYLANKTRAYRSTLLKLAKGLGVSVQQLPR